MGGMVLYSHGNKTNDEKTHYELVNLLGGNLESIGYVPSTPESVIFFESIKKHYTGLGFKTVKCLDIHNSFDNNVLSELLSCSAIHLSAGNPIYLSSRLKQLGLNSHLVKYCEEGGIIIGNSGGSMQVTRSVNLYKLFCDGLEKVIKEYDDLLALGLVNFEFLPHYNLHKEEFIALVQQYTIWLDITVYGCADGGAIIIDNKKLKFIGETYKIKSGEIMRIK